MRPESLTRTRPECGASGQAFEEITHLPIDPAMPEKTHSRFHAGTGVQQETPSLGARLQRAGGVRKRAGRQGRRGRNDGPDRAPNVFRIASTFPTNPQLKSGELKMRDVTPCVRFRYQIVHGCACSAGLWWTIERTRWFSGSAQAVPRRHSFFVPPCF